MARLQFWDAETEMEIMAATHQPGTWAQQRYNHRKQKQQKYQNVSKIEIDIFCDAVSDT